MTDLPPDEDPRLVAPFEGVLDAAFRLDEPGVNESVDELLQLVGSEDAAELGFALTEEFVSEPDPSDGVDPEYVDAVRRLLLDALLRFGRRHPSEAYLLAFLTAAEDATSDGDSQAAETWASLAAQVATDADARAEAHALLAIARSELERPAEALADARLADAGATELDTRLLTRWVLLTLLCDENDPEATPLALDAVVWCPHDPEQSWVPELRQAVQRAVINEEARRESAGTPPHPDSSGILRLALADPTWIPDGLSVGYMAAIIAWIEYLADDLTRLEETLTFIGDDELDVDTAARVAMLRVLVPVGSADVAGAMRELREAALVVNASSNPQVHTAFVALSEFVRITLQGGDMGPGAATMDADSGPGQAMRLVADIHAVAESTLQQGKPAPPDLVARVDAWLASAHPDVDLATQALVWAFGGMVSASIGQYPLAEARADQARALASSLPGTSAQRVLLIDMIDGLSAVLLLNGDADAGVAALERLHAEQMAAGRPLLAFVTAAQLTLQYLRTGRFADALRRGVTALEILAEYRESLPGSSERGSVRSAQESLYVSVLKAAAAHSDPRVLAELLEYLRAQDMPVVHHDPAPSELPLAALIAGPGARLDPREVVDAVAVGRPAPVRMPWGSLALEGLVRPPSSAPVSLVVARLSEAGEHAL